VTDPAVTVRSRTYARALFGMEAARVIVETHLHGGLPGTTLVGVPETAVREARDRVRSALINCGFDYPDGRVVVNLAPADLTKEGGRFDLAIAVSILRASGQLLEEEARGFDYEFLGELSLSGELRGVRGCLCAARELADGDRLIVPRDNLTDARWAGGRIQPLAHLKDVVNVLRGTAAAPAPPPLPASAPVHSPARETKILGQTQAKRALAIAAAGGHHLLMVGPPGTGKSLLAATLPGLLPALSNPEAMEVAAVYSAAGLELGGGARRPFRAPHHSISATAMTGGGSHPRPGEISLAHRGVLFLDELPHFKPSVLDCLREPLETRTINISRASGSACFPASFQLIAAMNPCPAGLVCTSGGCRCRPDQVQRYRSRISGPLLDRIDLHVPVAPVAKALLLGEKVEAEDPLTGPEAVNAAFTRALERQGKANADLSVRELERHVPVAPAARKILGQAADRFSLSARAFHRVLRVARSIADLEGETTVGEAPLIEALSYRAMDWSAGHPAAQ
jgi:magnesium chelatase family protein